MPLNLVKLTSSIYLHNHHKWVCRAITIGKPKTPLQFAPQKFHFNNNNNKDNININININYRFGFGGVNSFRYCSVNKGMDFVNSDNKDRDPSGLPTLPSNDNGHVKPHPSKQNPSAKLLTLPTVLTIARVASVPLLISTFYIDSRFGTNATTGIFIAASVTDWLDGYLARRMNLGTAFGAFLDPVADKLMVAATLVLLCTRPPEAAMFGQLPWLLTVPAIAIIGREITMSAVREWAASQGSKLSEAVAVNNLGKWKTATQMIALTILLVIRDSSVQQDLPPPLDSTSEPPPVFDGTTRLYISYTCPYAQRVWITRNCKGLQEKIKLVPIDLKNRPDWYKEKVYPANKVPALEHNNEVKGESLDLIKYINTNFEGPSLYPEDTIKQEFGEELISYTDTFYKSVTTSLKGDGFDDAAAAFDYIEKALSKFDDGPFFLGQFSLVDIAYAPFIERFQPYLLDVKNYDIKPARPKLAAWIEEMNKNDDFNQTRRDPKELVESYRKRYLSSS